MPSLQLTDVDSGYNGVDVLQRINLSVTEPSIYVVLGPNGAGKTTTIRILATILEPTAGTATVEGHDVRSEPLAVKTSIGYMPEVPGYYPTMTADQHLDYWGAFYHMPRAERKARTEELLDLVGLGEERAKKVKAYSHGMLKRLGLAQALLHDPHVLILDEPAGGLDPYGIIFFRNLVKELNKQGKTIFLSSHILSEVAQTCTHVGVIHKGKIVAVDTTEAIQSRIGGTGIVRCLIEAPNVPDSALRGLLDIGHVKDVQRTDWGLIVSMDKDARSSVNAFLVGLGVPVMGLKLAEVTLEDAFVALTGGAPP